MFLPNTAELVVIPAARAGPVVESACMREVHSQPSAVQLCLPFRVEQQHPQRSLSGWHRRSRCPRYSHGAAHRSRSTFGGLGMFGCAARFRIISRGSLSSGVSMLAALVLQAVHFLPGRRGGQVLSAMPCRASSSFRRDGTRHGHQSRICSIFTVPSACSGTCLQPQPVRRPSQVLCSGHGVRL